MSRLLDTNVCVHYLNGRAPSVRSKLEARDTKTVFVCSVVKAELFFGAARSLDPARTLANQQQFLSQFVSLQFDDACAEKYAAIRAALAATGTPIGPNDLLIAAIALANQLTLVTHNTSEFGRVPGLSIEDCEV